MIRRPPRSTRTDTLFPYTTLFRSNRGACGGYSARLAQQQMQARRQVCRPMRKLLPGSERFELVTHMLRERLSPEQIAGKLRSMNIPNLRDAYVCRETIYNAIRTEERRVGKESVGTFRSRWSQ